MFYSHEILTRREYGVATIWLVATLGAKSSLKKLNRKAIFEVDVHKACETIVSAEAPLALRLQGNLLFGVSKVYSQQCTYVLQDAQAAQTSMKALMKVVKTSFLDPNAGKTKPDQLNLQYDPGFFPSLSAIDLDLPSFDDEDLLPPSNRTASLLDPASQNASLAATSASDVTDGAPLPALIIPTSETGESDRYVLPSETHRHRQSGCSPFRGDDDDRGFDLDLDLGLEGFAQDVDFEFDQHGNIRDLATRKGELAPVVPATPILQPLGLGDLDDGEDVGLAVQTTPRPRSEATQQSPRHFLDAGDNQAASHQNLAKATLDLLRSASAAPPQDDQEDEEEAEAEREISPDRAEAPAQTRRRQAKIIGMDNTIELSSSNLSLQNRNYLQSMDKAMKLKQTSKILRQAKKNAQHWVFGTGIGLMISFTTYSALSNPLSIFSGDQLMQALLPATTPRSSPKRARGESDDDEESGSEEKRARLDKERDDPSQDEADNDEEMGMANSNVFTGNDYDPFNLSAGDFDTEIGRAPAAPLEDVSSTNAMPWNTLASARASQHGSVASARGPSLTLSGAGGNISSVQSSSGMHIRSSRSRSRGPPGSYRRDSRRHGCRTMTASASPSLAAAAGRRLREGDLERLSSLELEGDERGVSMPPLQLDDDEEGMDVMEDGEQRLRVFKPKMGLSTQDAADSQKVRNALDEESFRFLEFVRHSIEEQQQKEEDHGEQGDDDDDEQAPGSVTFQDILPAKQTSKLVATHAFLHILTLTTKGFMNVRQEKSYDDIHLSSRI